MQFAHECERGAVRSWEDQRRRVQAERLRAQGTALLDRLMQAGEAETETGVADGDEGL